MRKFRPITLQYHSKKLVSSFSISDFCKKVGLNDNSKFHITPILQGKRFHHKGWHLPFDINVILVDIHGHEYKVNNFWDFSKKYKINPMHLKNLINGKIKLFRGLFLKNNRPDNIRPQLFKYECTFENNDNQIKGTNITEIGRLLNSERSGFAKLSLGVLSNHKGWIIKKVKLIRKSPILH